MTKGFWSKHATLPHTPTSPESCWTSPRSNFKKVLFTDPTPQTIATNLPSWHSKFTCRKKRRFSVTSRMLLSSPTELLFRVDPYMLYFWLSYWANYLSAASASLALINSNSCSVWSNWSWSVGFLLFKGFAFWHKRLHFWTGWLSSHPPKCFGLHDLRYVQKIFNTVQCCTSSHQHIDNIRQVWRTIVKVSQIEQRQQQ